MPGTVHDWEPGWEPHGRTTFQFSERVRVAYSEAAEVTDHCGRVRMPAQGSTDLRVAVWVAVHRGATPSRETGREGLIQLEPIRTTMPRAASAVGFTSIRVRILERARRIDLANADANNGLDDLGWTWN